MTEPAVDTGRETQVVTIAGRTIVVRKLVDLQMLHLMRHAKILQKDDIDIQLKLDSAVKMFDIVSSAVVQPSDREFLVDLEERGEIGLKDLLGFLTVFKDEEPKPKARRGRAPVKR